MTSEDSRKSALEEAVSVLGGCDSRAAQYFMFIAKQFEGAEIMSYPERGSAKLVPQDNSVGIEVTDTSRDGRV